MQQILRSWGYNARNFAIVGINELSFQLAENIEASPQMGLRLVGFFDDRPRERTPDIPAALGRQVGTIQDLVEQARRGAVDRIYITFPMRAEARIRRVLDQLGDATASVYVVPDFFVFQLLHSRWTDILGLPVVSVFENPFYGIDGLAKRLSDVCFGGVLLAAAAVPMVVIALLIKLTSPGPIFFRQRRYGLDGREIHVWKFRTMTVCEDGPQAVQAKRNDSRVTPLGAVLRQLSLDELPQLFNVLEGSMSLVGPRPHPNALNDEFRTRIGGYMLRHKVKPGITGLAQVNGWRGETDSPEKMKKRIEFDHRYIREWSLWMDIQILRKPWWLCFPGRMPIRNPMSQPDNLLEPILSSALPAALPPAELPQPTAAATIPVLHVINGEHYAGAERVQDLLGKRLPAFGFSVGFACVKLDLFDELREARDAPLYDVPMLSRFDLWTAWRIAQIVRRAEYRIIHGHTVRTRHGRQHGRADWPACRWSIMPTARLRTTPRGAGGTASTARSSG